MVRKMAAFELYGLLWDIGSFVMRNEIDIWLKEI